ncbi:hypothetical protein LJC60_05640 [Ruminococcaceae bacterium OttesenSCG-928-D13]|nr:hypothetical protein [Ruminococcaceae bacterium OttesenSCG-928-D13]
MSKYGSEKHQVVQRVNEIFKPGVSRREVQQLLGIKGTTYSPYIHSYSYRDTAIRQGTVFLKWAKETYDARSLKQAERHVDNYIRFMRENSWSAWSQKLVVACLAKLYGTHSTDYAPTDSRRRVDIKRSQGPKANDRNFNEERHREFVNFEKTVGLRRSEYRTLIKNDVRTDRQGREFVANHLVKRDDGRWVLQNVVGKGGKYRNVLLAGPHVKEAVERIQATKDGERVWPTVPKHYDIHGGRHQYAQALYMEVARDPTTLPRSERYECRGDMAGVWFDRRALEIVSASMGHNRACVSVLYVRG